MMHFTRFLALITLITPITAGKLCNSFKPDCGLTPTDALRRYATPYAKLLPRLRTIKRAAQVPLQIGPLIRKRGAQWGVFNIDTPLSTSLLPSVKSQVCDPSNNTAPTIRDAVICTVLHDAVTQPPVGNTDPDRIGFSNHGRRLLAVRLGNPDGFRLFIATQLHGNEFAATEAAIRLLRKLTRTKRYAKSLLSDLDIVIALRVNPDGGEPTASASPPLFQPYTRKSGFFRHNVDRTAGGGFAGPSEQDFFGVVGRGYNLNRYVYAALHNAIRPVEAQALVGALHAFRPNAVFDLHGDLPKVICPLNPASVRPGGLLEVLPTVECSKPSPPIPTLSTARKRVVVSSFFGDDASILSGPGTESLTSGPQYTQNVRFTRSIVGELKKKLLPRIHGKVARFNAISTSGVSPFSDGTLDRGGMALGAVGSGWEVLTFEPEVRAAIFSLSFLPNGTSVPVVSADPKEVDACFVKDNICLNYQLLRMLLPAVTRFAGKERILGDNGFCTIPTDDAVLIDTPVTGGFGAGSTNGTVMTPQGGQFGVPVEISGVCAGDASV